MDLILVLIGLTYAFVLGLCVNWFLYENIWGNETPPLESEEEVSTGRVTLRQSEQGPKGEALTIFMKDTKFFADFRGDNRNVKVIPAQFVVQNDSQIPTEHLTDKDTEYLKRDLRIVWSSERSWLIPLPWLEEVMLPPEDYFVHLDLELMSSDGLPSKGSVSPQLEDILLPLDGTDLIPKRILVRGEVGYGKTTLCIKLAQVWATGQPTSFLSRFNYALLYRFRDIPEGDPETSSTTLEDELIKEFLFYVRPNVSFNSMKSLLRDESEQILVLLDGYDECRSSHLDSVHRVLSTSDPDSTFFASTIIVTSRPLTDPSYHRYFSKHMKIAGLNEVSRNDFVDRFFGHDPDFVETLKKQLNVVHSSFGNSISPFMLYLICFLYEERQLTTFETQLELMRKLLTVLGKRCIEKEDDLKHLTPDLVDLEFVKLGKVFYRSLRDSNILIDQSFFDEVFVGDQTFVKKCGLLKKPFSAARRRAARDSAWEPVHKSFMEYLSYFYLKFCLDHNLESEKRARFVSSLKLDLFDASVLYRDRYEFSLILTVVSGVRLVFNLPPDPDQEVLLDDCNFLMLNDEMYSSYHRNSCGCDVPKARFLVRHRLVDGESASLCPFEIRLDDDREALLKLAKCIKYLGLLNIRYPNHVFPEFLKTRTPGSKLEKYLDNNQNGQHLVLQELDLGLNHETWPSFLFRIWILSTLLLESDDPFPIVRVEGMSAATLFHRLCSSLSGARCGLDVVVSFHRSGSFRFFAFYDRCREDFHFCYVDVFGRKLQKCIRFENTAEALRHDLNHVIFFERDDSLATSSLCRLSGFEAESILLFSSTLTIYEDPDMCATRVRNQCRSDFELKFDLDKLPFPEGKSLVLEMFCTGDN